MTSNLSEFVFFVLLFFALIASVALVASVGQEQPGVGSDVTARYHFVCSGDRDKIAFDFHYHSAGFHPSRCTWQFGEYQQLRMPAVTGPCDISHTYSGPGNFKVTVNADDGHGNQRYGHIIVIWREPVLFSAE